jgi:hypothetical protein
VKNTMLDTPSPRAAGRGGEWTNQLPNGSDDTGGRAETYVVHGHQPLPAQTGRKAGQDAQPVQSFWSSTCSPSAEYPELSSNLKRDRRNQPWEIAVARQVVLTPTGPRPVLARADQVVMWAAAVQASDADASIPKEITWVSTTGPAPSELPNQLSTSTRRRKKRREAKRRRSVGPTEGGCATASLTGLTTKRRSCYAQLEAPVDIPRWKQEGLSFSTAREEVRDLARASQVAWSDGEAETRPSHDSTAVDPDGGSVVPGVETAGAREAAVGGERDGSSFYIKGCIERWSMRYLVNNGVARQIRVPRMVRVTEAETVNVPDRVERLVLVVRDSRLNGKAVNATSRSNADGVPENLLVARSATTSARRSDHCAYTGRGLDVVSL